MTKRWGLLGAVWSGGMLIGIGGSPIAIAQDQRPSFPPDTVRPPQPAPVIPDDRDRLPAQDEFSPLNELLSPPADPNQTVPSTPDTPPPSAESAELTFREFRLQDSLAFDDAELTAVIQSELQEQWPGDRPASFSEFNLIAQAVYDYYRDNGYLLAGLNLRKIKADVAIIQVQEWEIGNIEVAGLRRLRTDYVRSRLASAAKQPVDVSELQEALRLLQSDPLIDTFEATLSQDAGAETATLRLDVQEANTFTADLRANNGRSESIGTNEQGIGLQEANLLGFGDRLALSYNRTDGTNSISGNYTIPLSPQNTTLTLSYATSDSAIIQAPFDAFDIESNSRYYDLTLRHPLVQTPAEEVALGLTLSRWETESRFLEDVLGESIPLPTRGSDDQGRTRLSVVRFSQEWTRRDRDRVLALRSQFNLGLDVFDATINEQSPDGQFLSWQGQGQYIQRVSSNTLLLLRGQVQLSDRPLVPLEQFALGGVSTVRGYQRDAIVADNGALLSAELQVPILRLTAVDNGVVQLAPFMDLSWGWNNGGVQPTADFLAAVGVGLQWRSDSITARLDYGIPITNTSSSLEDTALRFSLSVSPF